MALSTMSQWGIMIYIVMRAINCTLTVGFIIGYN